jgi:hypothetical protein
MAFSLLENILSTCTSSNNPLPESPPTTIILFPMTVAACYTRRRRKKKSSNLQQNTDNEENYQCTLWKISNIRGKKPLNNITLKRGVGSSPEIDNTIQFSAFPDVEALISSGAEEEQL